MTISLPGYVRPGTSITRVSIFRILRLREEEGEVGEVGWMFR